MKKLVVVTAGLSEPSSTRLLADRLAAATVQAGAVQGSAGLEVRVVELRDLAHDLMNHLLTGFPPAALKAALTAVEEADGLVAVTPIFNASYSGLFKSFFDVLRDDALADKPVLLGATGGTARHSLALEHALRPLFAYLRAVTVPTAVFAAAEDWASDTPARPHRPSRRRAGPRDRPPRARHGRRPVRVDHDVRRPAGRLRSRPCRCTACACRRYTVTPPAGGTPVTPPPRRPVPGPGRRR